MCKLTLDYVYGLSSFCLFSMNHIDIQYVYLSLPLLLLIIIYYFYFIVKSQFNSIVFIYRAQFIHNPTLKCFTQTKRKKEGPYGPSHQLRNNSQKKALIG